MEPSGARTTARIRPWLPTRREESFLARVPVSRTRRRRSPRSAPMYSVRPAMAAPLGEASEVGQVILGLVKRPPRVDPRPSTTGQP